MKLRNKKTGEIIEKYPYSFVINSGEQIRQYDSLGELYAEWEDYEEPKEYWYIESDGSIIQNHKPTYINHLLDCLKSIGNYFETREQAEKAVEKLNAWKRLKDKGFRFKDFGRLNDCAFFIRATSNESWSELYDDLDLLFGDEQ